MRVAAGDELTICAVSDANYASGLRVAIFSALEALTAPARVVVVDAGLDDPGTWKRVVGRHPRCSRCDLVAADLDAFSQHPGLDRFGLAKWIRLFLPELVPDVDRLIYLDSDVLVRADLGLLWALPTNGAPIAAVRDFFLPTFATGLPHAVSACGFPADTPYFNSGVLVLDLEVWRRKKLTQLALGYVRDHGPTIRFADQDPLNVVAAGRIRELDPRWNVQMRAVSTREVVGHNAIHGLLSDADALRRDANIVHFNGLKPWQPESILASRRSMAFHVEFARITARFTDNPRDDQLAAALDWARLMFRRCVSACWQSARERLERSVRESAGRLAHREVVERLLRATRE